MTFKNIIIYTDETCEQNYNNPGIWGGSIFWQNNGYFEGIVRNKDLNEEDFVFGIMYKNNYVLMYKISPNVSSKPIKIEAKLEAGSLEGNFSEIVLFGELLCGNCKIHIRDRKIGSDTIVSEMFLEKKIYNYKDTKLDALSLDFYNRKLNVFEQLTENDLVNMMNEFNLINRNLVDEKVYYNLTRKVTNIFDSQEFQARKK